MKKILLLLALMSCMLVQANIWYPFGPQNIKANNVCFLAMNTGIPVICSDDGFYLYDGVSSTHHMTGTPVMEAAWLNGEDFLFVQGDGSFSDGIYVYYADVQQSIPVEFCYKPHFIRYNIVQQNYLVGCQGALLQSVDGETWSHVPFFEGKDCVCMEQNGDCLIVGTQNNPLGTLAVSYDNGSTWAWIPGAPLITDLLFTSDSTLWGIFPQNSNSSGLWKSVDQGLTWSVVVWTDNLKAVGSDMAGHVFTGWYDNSGNNAGTAWYHAATSSLISCNNGLSSLKINRFQTNPLLSSIKIFCCTDSGVYFMDSYIMGNPLLTEQNPEFRVSPNPCTDKIRLEFLTAELLQSGGEISVFDAKGILVRRFDIAENHGEITLYPGTLPAGLYELRLSDRKGRIVGAQKLLVSK